MSTSQEESKLTNLSLFLWKNSEKNRVAPCDEGLFIFKISDVKKDQDHTMTTSDALGTTLMDHCRRVIVNFKLESLREDKLHYFVDHIILKTNKVVHPRTKGLFLIEISEYITSCFRFRVMNARVRDVDRPTVVFVADVTVDNLILADVVVNNRVEEGYNDNNNNAQTIQLNQVDLVDYVNRMYECLERIDTIINRLVEFSQSGFQFVNSDTHNFWRSSEELSNGNVTFRTSVGEHSTDHVNTNMEFAEVEDVKDCNAEEFNHVLGILEEHTKYDSKLDGAEKMIEEETSRVAKRAKVVQDDVAPKRSRLSKIKPTIELVKVEELREDNVCSICLEKMSSEVENIKMVRCNHVFHRRCISKWLPKKQSCPYCRSSSLAIVTL